MGFDSFLAMPLATCFRCRRKTVQKVARIIGGNRSVGICQKCRGRTSVFLKSRRRQRGGSRQRGGIGIWTPDWQVYSPEDPMPY